MCVCVCVSVSVSVRACSYSWKFFQYRRRDSKKEERWIKRDCGAKSIEKVSQLLLQLCKKGLLTSALAVIA